MKYTVSLEIDRPRDEVARLFADVDARPKWQRGFESAEVLEGEAGQPGAKSKLVFRMGKRGMEMIETLGRREPPELFESSYDTKGVHNIVVTRLEELEGGRTRIHADNEFRFSGMMKIVGFLAKKAFPRQTLKYMTDFKIFAETGLDVRDVPSV